MLVRVFHNNDLLAMGIGYQPGDSVRLVFEYPDTSSVVVDHALERAFDLFNDQVPADGEGRWLADTYYHAAGRSLSTGDVLEVSGRYYACQGYGWDEIATPRITEPAPKH